MMSGELCAMMTGTSLMPLWCVNSLDTPLKVKHCFRFSNFLVHVITQTLYVAITECNSQQVLSLLSLGNFQSTAWLAGA